MGWIGPAMTPEKWFNMIRTALKSDSKKTWHVSRARMRSGAGRGVSVFKRGLFDRGVACGLPVHRHPRFSGYWYLHITHVCIGGIGYPYIIFIFGHRKIRQRRFRNAVVFLRGRKPRFN